MNETKTDLARRPSAAQAGPGPGPLAHLRAAWLRLPRRARRAGSGAAGVTLIAAGAALLVLPGPGLVVIALGLGVLATEYERPRRLLRGVTERVRAAAERARSRA